MHAIPQPSLPIIIGGVNRSGTSLMRRLIGSHSQVSIPPTDFEFFRITQDLAIGTAGERRETMARLLEYPKIQAWGLPREEVLAAAEQAGSSDRDLFLLLLEQYRRLRGTPRCGWKTPMLEFHLDRLDAWFGQSYRFVHLVRHPLDTYASNRWYEGQERRLYTEGWANQWARSAAIAIRRSVTQKNQYRLVRYEDLIASPWAILVDLCEFVGLRPEIERMLSMCEYSEKDNSSFSSVGDRRYDGEIRRSDTVDRRALLDADEVATVLRICAYPAELLGYDPDARRALGPAQRAGAAFDELPLRSALIGLARYAARRVGSGLGRILARRPRQLD